ncbi:MFS transporter, partial [Bacillus velezensis]|nr:MFS transporter [Bacillus velezensis]
QHFGAVTGFTAILFILSMTLYQTISKTGKRQSTARAQL